MHTTHFRLPEFMGGKIAAFAHCLHPCLYRCPIPAFPHGVFGTNNTGPW